MRSWRSAMADAAFATLAHPEAWPVALAGFLARGGILVLLVPIFVVPTTPQLAILVAPALTPLVFGQPSAALDLLIAGLVVAAVVAILAGCLVGAWADLVLVRFATAEEAGGGAEPTSGSGRALAARLVAHLPLATALAWGAMRVVDAGYRELVTPDDVTIPLIVRVLRDVPDAVALIVLAWLAGETIGGLAARRLAEPGASVGGALAWSVRRLVARPVTSGLTLVVANAAVLLVAAPCLVASAIAWHALGAVLASNAPLEMVLLAVGLLVVLWLSALVLVSVTTTYRAFAWTFEATRPPAVAVGTPYQPSPDPGTIGSGEAGRPGEWPAPGASGRL